MAEATEDAAQQRQTAEQAEAALKAARHALQAERWTQLLRKQQASLSEGGAGGVLAAPATAVGAALRASSNWVPVLDFQSDRPLTAADEAVVARVIASQVMPVCRTTYTYTTARDYDG